MKTIWLISLGAIALAALPASQLLANDVARVQNYLSQLGYDPGPIDGQYGSQTEAALAEFYTSIGGVEYDGELSRNEIVDLARSLGIDLPGVVGAFSTIERAIPTTHFQAAEEVEAIYAGYERFINGEFDFPSLRLSEGDFVTGEFVGESKTDDNGYYLRTMIQFADQGDVDGDGDNDLVVVGWRADGENSPARLHYLLFDSGVPAQTASMALEGSSAVWLEDFDSDGAAEALAVGFLDFPVMPAPTYYVDGTISQSIQVGPPIDSHESNVLDFDGDGDLDVVAITYGNASRHLSVYVNDYGIFTHRYVDLGFDIAGTSVEFADFDGDQRPELIVGDSSYPRNDGRVWRFVFEPSDDPFRLRVASSSAIAPQYFSAAEFDGIRSFWEVNWPNGNRRWLEGIRSHDLAMEAVDIDIDGDLDLLNSSILWNDSEPLGIMGVMQILINDGAGNFTDETADRLFNFQRSTPGGGHTFQVIDVNYDGFPDVVVSDAERWNEDLTAAGLAYDQSRITGGNKLLINDGTGHFVEAHQSIFTEFTALEGWANSWFPVVNPDGTLTFVSLFRTSDGQQDLWQFARLREPLSTGPFFTDPADQGVPGFNEFFVLRTNQTAREAVLSGEYESALEWFMESGAEIAINVLSEPVRCLQLACGSDAEDEPEQEVGVTADSGLSHTEQLRIRLGLPESAPAVATEEHTLSHTQQLRIRLQQQRDH